MRVRVRVSEKGERIKNKKRGDPKADPTLLENSTSQKIYETLLRHQSVDKSFFLKINK